VSDDVIAVARTWLGRLEESDPAPELCDPESVIENVAEFPITGPYHGRGTRRSWPSG
jgi:hypothetical protein